MLQGLAATAAGLLAAARVILAAAMADLAAAALIATTRRPAAVGVSTAASEAQEVFQVSAAVAAVQAAEYLSLPPHLQGVMGVNLVSQIIQWGEGAP